MKGKGGFISTAYARAHASCDSMFKRAEKWVEAWEVLKYISRVSFATYVLLYTDCYILFS